jgi:hypothetical protein
LPEADRKPLGIAVPPLNEEFVRKSMIVLGKHSGGKHSLVKRMLVSLTAFKSSPVAREVEAGNEFDSRIEGPETVDTKLFLSECDIW